MKRIAERNIEATLILHDIRSAENVGAIFRTADACGVSKIYLTGYTPTPVDRFGRPRQDIAKASLGAEKSVLWESVKNPTSLIKRLKKEGATIIGVEQSPKSIDYKKVKAKEPLIFIFGNEVTGVPKNILSLCDIVAEIPMRGMKESLNVSVSAGIVLSRILNL